MPTKPKKKATKKPARTSKASKPAKRSVKALKPAKTPAATKTTKSVLKRIQEVVVKPRTEPETTLITPLPQREVRNFGVMPFESQAKLVLETFPADANEIIGSTQNSGPGTVSAPRVAGS